MSGVEALEQTTQAPIIPQTETITSEPVNLDTELDGIWDRAYVTNGADRGDGGKFVSPNGEQETPEPVKEPETPSLEGETGEEQSGSTPAVPLPANRLLSSLDPEWATLAPEVQQKLTERSNELHAKLSEQGAFVSKFKPLNDAATEFAEYFNGNLKSADGQSITPADGIRYLANIQRAMDKAPLDTLLSIADTYGLREKLAEAFGGQVTQVPADQQQLLREIAGLKQTISGLQSPAMIERVLNEREVISEVSRFAESKPHYAAVEADLPFFIGKAKTQLGPEAKHSAILDKAYELAVQADPALRAQTEAATTAASKDAAKAVAAKQATSVNVTSTSSGKARAPSIDDELSAIWDKSRKA
jgi:hypothetical protein